MRKSRQVILFQGDSITDGKRDRGSDLNHILGHSYAYIIAAKLGHEHADKQPLFINRGISGNRASDLYARWNEDALSLHPDVISILIGVNDAWRTVSGEPSGVTDRFERAYRHVLEETKEKLPETKLVLCGPFILRTGATDQAWDQWMRILSGYQDTVRRLVEEFNAVHVPLQAAFDEATKRSDAAYWLWDGVHPTAAGHDLVAAQWLAAVQQSGILE
ncbi:SGNH/GDSL hydrolase family protein [Paenibacillus sp. XY044]|uniref:SGNH/GDSL hydrolase family protein n=1 Tax=Paenibacillus sp. XY044 TaxID=2026089 RepID=UPI000B98DF35|nr:SGNH/GDSL hydrolase family protein [Paenibacillus sp. XY044]OZB90463.1 lysophospholipase [Paenibacillus sp. XY044]